MIQNEFQEWERVCVICVDGEVAGFSTFTEKDELSEEYGFAPFIGFVFVDERYRGKRLPETMIQSIISYAKELEYEKIYIMSGKIIGVEPGYGVVKSFGTIAHGRVRRCADKKESVFIPCPSIHYLLQTENSK